MPSISPMLPDDYEPSHSDWALSRELAEAFGSEIGPTAFCFRAVESELANVDVCVIKPTDDYPCYFMYTSGYSLVPDTVEGRADMRCELQTALSADWYPKDAPTTDEDVHSIQRPLVMLRSFMVLPAQGMRLRPNAIIQNTEECIPYAPSTELGACLLMPGVVPIESGMISRESGEQILLPHAFPLYKEEAEFVREKSIDELYSLMQSTETYPVIDSKRPRLVPTKEKEYLQPIDESGYIKVRTLSEEESVQLEQQRKAERSASQKRKKFLGLF